MTELSSASQGAIPVSSGVIRIAQDNDQKHVRIVALSETLVWLLGFDQEVLSDQEFRTIITKQVSADIDEYVDYSDKGRDVGDVLSKCNHMALLTANGEVVPIEIKVHNSGVENGAFIFDIMVRTAALDDNRGKEQTLAHSMALRGDEVLDEHTGVPNRASFVKDLELLLHIMQRDNASKACMVTLRLCNYHGVMREHDQKAADRLLKLVAYCCRDNLRSDDVVARVADDALSMLMLDTDIHSAPIVINRLRMALNALRVMTDGDIALNPQITYAVTGIQPDDTSEGLSELMDQSLDYKMSGEGGGSSIVQMRS